jgi:thiopeptide-type bacteriocin biosynthesis protein
MVGKSKQIELLEFLFQPDNCLVKDKEGRMYSNEFIMTFAKETENPYHEGNETEITNINSYKTKRVFSIGSEWIFFKIYLGFKTADEILFAFRKIIYKFKQKGIITQWFFIRFNDPKYHLRIRIHIQHKDSIGMILSEVYKTFNPKIKTGKIANIQIDTYRREIERYGADTIDLVEKYFELQSEIIIDFLKVTMNDSEQDMLKFLFAIKFLDIILTDFGINLENRKKFVDNSLKSFENEFQIHSVSKKQITKKYLFFEPLIISIFENTPNELNNWHLLNDLITKHSNLRVALINEIKMKSIKYKNNATRDSLIWSLNHMFINKLARSKFRKFEYIVYAIFEKYLNKLYHKTGIIKTII